MIPDLAVAARRLSAARRTHPYITRSDRTLSPGHACAARRKRPSHADGEMALRCRLRKPPSPQLGAEAAPIPGDHRLQGWNRVASPQRDGRIPAEFRRPSNGKHEGSRIVHPMIPDLAVAVRRLSAARRTRPHVSRSDRMPSPGHACAARRKGPSHADTEMALRCRPRTPATPQLGVEAAPIQIIVCEGGTEWLRRGETAASLPDSDGRPMATRSVTNRQSDDPGP